MKPVAARHAHSKRCGGLARLGDDATTTTLRTTLLNVPRASRRAFAATNARVIVVAGGLVFSFPGRLAGGQKPPHTDVAFASRHFSSVATFCCVLVK